MSRAVVGPTLLCNNCLLWGFFDDAPPPPEPVEPDDWSMPPWFGPPDNVLGQLVASQSSLAINAQVAIAIEGFTVYPTGVAFRLVAITNGGQWMGNPFFDRHPSQSGSGATLQFGIELADGRKTTVNNAILSGLPENEPPPAPVLTCAGGGGGGRRWTQELWLWPLPPPGPLSLVVEWPAMGVSETRVEVDAGPLGPKREPLNSPIVSLAFLNQTLRLQTI